jgi:hypothetical protein
MQGVPKKTKTIEIINKLLEFERLSTLLNPCTRASKLDVSKFYYKITACIQGVLQKVRQF